MKFFILLILSFSFFNLVQAQTALTRELLKNNSFKSVYDSVKGDEQLSTAGTTFQDAIEKQKALANNPSERAKLIYQGKETSSPCSHCPKYLDLVLQVNNIVEKIEPADVAVANETLIQLTKLKFLYYFTKSNDPSKYYCNKYSPVLGLDQEIKKGKVTLLAEKALALPNVTDVQIYDPKADEAHYFYQGEGEENNTIIEVIINNKDRTAVLKYYRYDSGFKLPKLASFEPDPSVDNDGITIAPRVETENLVLPTDIKIGKAKSKIELPGGLDLAHQTDIGFNQQKTQLAVEGSTGEKFLVVEGVNNSGGSKIGTAVLNYGFQLDKESGLKLGTAIGTKLEATSDLTGGIRNNQDVEFGLTDHNNEYFKVKTVLDDVGVSSYSGSNKFKLGDGSIGSDVTLGREGDRSVGVTLQNQGMFDSIGARYLRAANGERRYSASVGSTIAKDTVLRTEYSSGAGQAASVAVNFERKISETTSMVLTVNSSTGSGGTSFLYQFQSKF